MSDDDGVPSSITYQWKRGSTDIGTNSATYVLVPADVGSTITVNAQYTDDHTTAENVTATTATTVTNGYFSYFSSEDDSASTERCWSSHTRSDNIYAATGCEDPEYEDQQSFAFDATTGLIHILEDLSKCVSFEDTSSKGTRVKTENCDSASIKTFAREGNVFKWTGSGPIPLVITAVDEGETNWRVYMRNFVNGDENQVWTPEVHRSLP